MLSRRFPQVERRRWAEPWNQISGVDRLLDPIRRMFGQRERALVRVRMNDDEDRGRVGSGGEAAQWREDTDDNGRVAFHWLNGVDIAPLIALACLMCAGLPLRWLSSHCTIQHPVTQHHAKLIRFVEFLFYHGGFRACRKRPKTRPVCVMPSLQVCRRNTGSCGRAQRHRDE